MAATAGHTGSGGSAVGGSAGDGGIATAVGGCQSVQGSCNATGAVLLGGCVDYAGLPSATLTNLQTNCQTIQATWSTSPCDTSDVVGGCLIQGNGICSVQWDKEVAQVAASQQTCVVMMGKWVTP